MAHKLRYLALAIGALCAMGAMMASSASAQETTGNLKVEKEATITGTDVVNSKLIYPNAAGQTVVCHGHYDIGQVGETFTVTGSPGKHKPVPPGKYTTLTVSPTYTTPIAEKTSEPGCIGHVGSTEALATVTMNGCDYVLHLNTTEGGAGEYGVEADLVCPEGKKVEIHVYSLTDTAHKTSVCTFTFGPQTGLKGARLKAIAGGKLTLGGTVKGISASREGVVCGGKNETKEAELEIDAEISATEESGGAATPLSIVEEGK